jgi:hypothetical protein
MGTDIHLYYEVRMPNGRWIAQRPPDKDPSLNIPWDQWSWRIKGNNRNSALFAILGNEGNQPFFYYIREKFGRKDFWYKEISPTRGIPEDLSYDLRIHDLFSPSNISPTGDYHSHSWLTLREIMCFDWSTRKLFIRDNITERQRKKWWGQLVIEKLGDRIDMLSEVNLDNDKDLLDKIGEDRDDWIYYRESDFTLPYSVLTSEEIGHIIDCGLMCVNQFNLSDWNSPDNVRIVYCFDN